jgi:hypothetical protein
MNRIIKKDLSISTERFNQIVKPKLKEVLGGEFLTVEGQTTDKMREILDILSGIDSWHVNKLKGIRGIASRIQEIDKIKYPYSKPFNTFTIRNKRYSGAKTEFEKRKESIEKNYLYPFFTIQAYINKNDNSLLSLAIAKTKDIIDYIIKNNPKTKNTGYEQVGQANFFIIKWTEFKNKNYRIYIYEKE